MGQPSPTEPIDRVCLHRNASIQKLLPAQLQQLFEEDTRQSVEEALCVLYVAVTRAIYSLYMIVKPSANSEKKLPKTAAGLGGAALTDGQRLAGNEVAFRSGDPRWYDKLTPRQAIPVPRRARRDGSASRARTHAGGLEIGIDIAVATRRRCSRARGTYPGPG